MFPSFCVAIPSIIDCNPVPENITPEVKKAIPSAVTIGSLSGKMLGSGFIYNKEGVVVTDAHVLLSIKKVYSRYIVVLHDCRQFIATPFFVGDSENTPNPDIAFLQIDNPPDDLTPARIDDGAQYQVSDFEEVYLLCNSVPYGNNQVKKGIFISGYHWNQDIEGAYPHIRIFIPIEKGNSGGLLVDKTGRSMGIARLMVQNCAASFSLFSDNSSYKCVTTQGYFMPIDMAVRIYVYQRPSM